MQKKIKELNNKYREDLMKYNDIISSDEYRKECFTEILNTKSDEMKQLQQEKINIMKNVDKMIQRIESTKKTYVVLNKFIEHLKQIDKSFEVIHA